jgi:hypothetical protein
MARQHRPLNPKSISEDVIELDAPKTPEGLRLAPRRAVSTPENVGELDQTARSDRSVSESNHIQRPITSPCGKKNYTRKHYLDKHKRDCVNCNRISNGGVDADSQRKRTDAGRLSTAECMIEVCSETSVGEVNKLTGNCSSEFQAYEQDCKRSSKIDVPGAFGDPGDSDRDIPSINTQAGPITAKTEDGAEINLEDDDYPEGRPSVDRSKMQADSPLIHDRLKEKLNRRLTSTDQRGYVYIFTDPRRPGLLKIGRTKSILKRMGQIDYACGLSIKLVKHFEVENYIRTESLIHTYILDLRGPYECAKCGRNHGEWFKISKHSAEKFAERWATFMTQERPYDANSNELRPFFQDLVRLRGGVPENGENDELRNSWIRILLPTATDRFKFQFDIGLKIFWKMKRPLVDIFSRADVLAVRLGLLEPELSPGVIRLRWKNVSP